MADMRRRPRLFGLCLALAIGFAGCTADDADPSVAPTTSSVYGPAANTLATSTTRAQVFDETAAVLRAYAEHWPAFDAFLSGRPPGDPADYFTGARLADLPRSVADFAERGIEIQGQATLSPGKVTIIGNKATFADCQVDSTTAVSRTTGEVVIPAATKPTLVRVELLKFGGMWKVSSVVYTEEKCVQ
jgi:hypothetical protein